MAEDKAQEKTHEATEKKKQDSRDKGQVPRSKELVSSLGLGIGSAALLMGMGQMGTVIIDVFTVMFAQTESGEMQVPQGLETCNYVLKSVIAACLIPLGFGWLGVAFVGGVQGQGAIPKEPIKFEIDKLNPLEQIKNQYFSSRAFVELAKGVIKLMLIGWLLVVAVVDRQGMFPAMMYQTPIGILVMFKEMAILVLSRALPVGIIIAVFDYLYEWWKMNEDMMMTREEVKDEQKDSDGDPHMKAARRQRMREIAMQKTLRAVSEADVVVTNPTHYAVCLRYRKGEAPAPVLIAKGVDHMAQRIKAEAARLGIPRVENRPLARALYAQTKEGQMISEELYGAVASLLAVIWKKYGRRKG
jgi:flagellar biosynthetic protein FlhB